MKRNLTTPILATWLLLGVLLLTSFGEKAPKEPKFPFIKAGLTERQAAAHLLSRFTYGAKPGQIDEVVGMGLEKWFLKQLQADLPNTALDQKLAGFNSLKLSNAQIAQTYPQGGQLLRMAIRDGVVDKDAVNKDAEDRGGKRKYRQQMEAYMQEKGYKPQRDLYLELINQKILRATYSENQLQEILTSFWFNHFNVSLTNKNCALYITSYERDVIRPNVLGNFETLLLATAKSPAMLTYLDNFKSSMPSAELTPEQKKKQQRLMRYLEKRQADNPNMQQMEVVQKVKAAKNKQGLNENYAREIMELHTLGVDGGYTQKDVTEAARVLTGWTLNPSVDRYKAGQNSADKNYQRKVQALEKQGFVIENDFVFAANKHDNGRKEVLGTVFPENGGYEEGLKLIKMLAHHPSTAKFISTKLAIRFVNDNPPQSLIDKMAKTFSQSKGDIEQVLLTMVSSKEFWSEEALREKTKSPFELAISSVRGLNAEVKAPYQLYTWITKMGERMYFYQAPTGFPDKGTYWINTGSLLNRMNFGLALASGKIPGVTLDLMALNKNREPESAEAALQVYSQYLLPERDLSQTIKRLTPTLNDPSFSQKVNAAAAKNQTMAQPVPMMEEEMEMQEEEQQRRKRNRNEKGPGRKDLGELTNERYAGRQNESSSNRMLAQVVGTIIGSPEFQRRYHSLKIIRL